MLAHCHGVPLIMDNTVPTPYLCRPFEHGADIVVHTRSPSTWAATAPAWCGAISPFNASLILQDIETLALRMDRISSNTLAIAQHLGRHAKVAWVNDAGLADQPDHALVTRYRSGQASSLLTFGLKGPAGQGRERGARFLDALELFTRLVNIGDVRSLATHPAATTTHRLLSPAELGGLACRKTPCACRWASSTSMACWQIWSRRWRRCEPGSETAPATTYTRPSQATS